MTQTHGAAYWDERYDQKEMVWSVGPNMFVEQVCADLPPARALDLAAGEGRNALWLARRGWQVTAVDFSAVGLDRARQLAAAEPIEQPGSLATEVSDLLVYSPAPQAYDLVLIAYLQVSADTRRQVVRMAAGALARGGLLLVVAHHFDNLEHGYAGPQDAAVLYTPEDITGDLAGCGLTVERAERVVRPVETDDGPRDALDTLVLARG